MALKKHNPNLSFVKAGWTGNKLNEKGLYTNIHGDDIKGFRDAWRMLRNPSPLSKLKKGQKSPLIWQTVEDISNKSQNAIIPLGHASFIFDLNEIRLLIDPVVVPNKFLKRYTKVPFDIPELNNVDYLLLSHNHRDHIDKKSIIQVCKYNPGAIILTGLEIGKLLRKWSIKNQIQEAGWYQRYETSKEIDIDYLPSHHWSRRWLTDTNINLWGSFMVQDKVSGKNIYFASDSGYQNHFSEIGNEYDIDIAMIGVGAYEPQWFMSSAHTGPTDALKAFKDLKAKRWMPMHYGTFDLSQEPVFYPEQVLKKQHSKELEQILWMKIGERIIF
ncbi:MBL fold metallo-hydrolase [Leeuwenhoekiella marinoflava]|uniref:L-ascorbate metabolism protein UlaG (Beta-lactamase superfamily) n=2 Tax=Leeuwenhoekiella marinoflava TaxID=988 RepID=A0A4Q0PMQ2_9FLAO|nr:MBL fold metallo-hydrolase [Leeuwenhoekiella marinoflava]RXG31816.1 L-ascorbate metabolism protein UlaG (beta-lactamase superfamily) [Leeuwenhoekiella marinoflava]SHF04074.1 L-ascorbate metabolism protein UlaG, beta-lactamase superfamily [Leeuwenhoekiella marinoflava DSM 3653]